MDGKTLGQLAEYVGGKVCGDENVVIMSSATLEQACKGNISFLANKKYAKKLETTKASAVVVAKETQSSASLLIAEDPYYAFTQITILLHGHREHKKPQISEKASVAKTASIGKNCVIDNFVTVSENASIGDSTILYPGVFVGEQTKIGDNCILYPNVVVYDKCTVGNGVIIHSNATIGGDGFGFSTHDGKHHKIPHIGAVILKDDVEIASNCSIERGSLNDTVIGEGTKIGDSVVIGHGTQIGPHCLLVPQVGIAGSVTIGHHCVIGGQSGVVGHSNIGNIVTIAARSGVINDVPDGKVLLGNPAIDAGIAKRAYSLIEYLPHMRKSIKKIEKKLSSLSETEKS